MARKELVVVDEPNLYEDIFDYDSVPRIKFNGKIYEEIDGQVVEFDPEEAVKSALHVHQQESPVGYSLRDFAWHSRWLAVNPTAPNYTPGDLSKYWGAVTGTDWDAHAAAPAPLDWPSIKSALAQNAAADPRYIYD